MISFSFIVEKDLLTLMHVYIYIYIYIYIYMWVCVCEIHIYIYTRSFQLLGVRTHFGKRDLQKNPYDLRKSVLEPRHTYV